jgi:hypothetical protein
MEREFGWLFNWIFIWMGLRSPDETLCPQSVRLMSTVERNIRFYFFFHLLDIINQLNLWIFIYFL